MKNPELPFPEGDAFEQPEDWQPEDECDETPDEEQITLSVQTAGVRFQAPLGKVDPETEDRPKSWREVLTLVNSSLMACVAQTAEVLVGIPQTVNATLKAVRTIPRSILARLEKGRESAVDREDARQADQQEQSSAIAIAADDLTQAQEKLTTLLEGLRAQGLCAEVKQVTPNLFAVVLGRPGLRQQAEQITDEAVRGLIESEPFDALALMHRIELQFPFLRCGVYEVDQHELKIDLMVDRQSVPDLSTLSEGDVAEWIRMLPWSGNREVQVTFSDLDRPS